MHLLPHDNLKICFLGCAGFSIHESRLSNGRYVCVKCNTSYKYRSGWYTHRKYNCGVKPKFSCTFCPYVSQYKHAMMQHVCKEKGLSVSFEDFE